MINKGLARGGASSDYILTVGPITDTLISSFACYLKEIKGFLAVRAVNPMMSKLGKKGTPSTG